MTKKKRDPRENLKNGKKFSKEYQPANRGRKRSLINQILQDYKLDNGGKELSKEDSYKLIEAVLNMTGKEMQALSENPDTPAWLISIASAVAADIRRGQIATVEKVWNRIFGYPKQDLDLSNPDGTLAPQTVLYIPDNNRK